MKKKIIIMLIVGLMSTIIYGCGNRQDAYNNEKMSMNDSTDASEQEEQPDDLEEEQPDDLEEEQTAGLEEESTGISQDDTSNYSPTNPNAVVIEDSTYDCDIEADKKNYDGKVDITVGDNYYATQINDWYMHFDEYEGKVVEIEGYYIGNFAPYIFVGRYGPSCPYCQGGYVSFEIFTDEDLSLLKSDEDWIKVTGILRQGNDSKNGTFYYIEVLSLEKMDTVGKDTVTN